MTNCSRCKKLCRASGNKNTEARLLTRSSSIGLCANCAVTEFLLSLEPIRHGIEKNGVEVTLKNANVRKQFEGVMKVGLADMKIEEIDWETIIPGIGLCRFPKLNERRKNNKLRNYQSPIVAKKSPIDQALIDHPVVAARLTEFWNEQPTPAELKESGIVNAPILRSKPKMNR